MTTKKEFGTVTFKWSPGSAEDETLKGLFDATGILYDFKMEIGYDHEVTFWVGFGEENFNLGTGLLFLFQRRCGREEEYYEVEGADFKSMRYDYTTNDVDID